MKKNKHNMVINHRQMSSCKREAFSLLNEELFFSVFTTIHITFPTADVKLGHQKPNLKSMPEFFPKAQKMSIREEVGVNLKKKKHIDHFYITYANNNFFFKGHKSVTRNQSGRPMSMLSCPI